MKGFNSFGQGSKYSEEMVGMKSVPCKPDYENMIAAGLDMANKCRAALNAIQEVEFNPYPGQEDIVKIIGYLYMSAANYQAAVDRMLLAQEQENKEQN